MRFTICILPHFFICTLCFTDEPRNFASNNNSSSFGGGSQSNGNGQNPPTPLPEDDEKSTRTLFVGNLEYSVTESMLRSLFSKYGLVQDVDIKRPMQGWWMVLSMVDLQHCNSRVTTAFPHFGFQRRAEFLAWTFIALVVTCRRVVTQFVRKLEGGTVSSDLGQFFLRGLPVTNSVFALLHAQVMRNIGKLLHYL